jgi:hypothetical protein
VKKPPAALRIFIAALCVASVAHAQEKKKSPSSKIYVVEINGDGQIDTGKEIDDLTKRAVYSAEGTVLETKANSNASIVFSNGTGVFLDVNTRIDVKKFLQEAFKPSKDDIENEPSISTTHVYVEQGVIGVSTSNHAAGSSMEYDTSLANTSIHGRQAVIAAGDNVTIISMVQGEATLRAGPLGGAYTIKNGQQAIVKPGPTGEANSVYIHEIPDGNDEEARVWLEQRVLTADDARKLVYFDVQGKKADGSISFFDGASDDSGNNEIVPVPVVPANPPVQPTVSAANLSGH